MALKGYPKPWANRLIELVAIGLLVSTMDLPFVRSITQARPRKNPGVTENLRAMLGPCEPKT